VRRRRWGWGWRRGSGGGGAAAAIRLNVAPAAAFTAPGTWVEVSRGGVVPFAFTCQDPDDDVLVSLFADRDADPATTGDSYAISLDQPETGPTPRTLAWTRAA